MIQASYAGDAVVYKDPRPEREMKIDTEACQEKEDEKTEKKEKYVYNPAGKTDPFVSFITGTGKGGAGAKSLSARDLELQGTEEFFSKEPQTELEKIEISKLTLTSIIKGKDKVWAMVIDPKGRGYFLEKGTKIGTRSGVVDEIICEERESAYGVETVKKVIIKIPYRDRNRNIIYRTIEMEMPYATM
jgi:hypothetical protein